MLNLCGSSTEVNSGRNHMWEPENAQREQQVTHIYLFIFNKNNHDDLLCRASAVIRRRSQEFTSSVAARVSASISWRRSPRRSSSPTTFTWSPMENTARRSMGRGTAWWERWGSILPLRLVFLRMLMFVYLPSAGNVKVWGWLSEADSCVYSSSRKLSKCGRLAED